MSHPRFVVAICALTTVLGLQAPSFVRADTFSDSAPADEYFGRRHESVLEMRNRLVRFEQRDDDDMYGGGVQRELDELASCMLDWKSQYPRDPWLPNMMWRLREQYRRVGGVDSWYAHQLVVDDER